MDTEIRGKFMDIIGADFDNIKDSFINRCKKFEMEFDEDVFMDTLLNCERVLGDKEMIKSDCLRYYWVAYANKLKTIKSKQDLFIPYDDILNYNIQQPLYDSYNPLIDSMYNEIVKLAYKKFDKTYVDAWLIHVCGGKSYKELRDMGYDFKFNDIFKRITRLIKKEYK